MSTGRFGEAENRPLVPVCPDHDITMRLRGIQGRPARFNRQSEEEYTLIYFCPIDDCDQSKSVDDRAVTGPSPGRSAGQTSLCPPAGVLGQRAAVTLFCFRPGRSRRNQIQQRHSA